jgi:tetratricopeptide (TPR) repeat protein
MGAGRYKPRRRLGWPKRRINQQIDLSGQSQAGDITLIGEQYNQTIKQRPPWLVALERSVAKHPGVVSEAIGLEALLAAGYFWFRDMYMISLWLWLTCSVLLGITIWQWYTGVWRRQGVRSLIIASVLTTALAGVLVWQGSRIVAPTRFGANDFGIVVAELGEGADYRRTKHAREISGQVFEYLRAKIAEDLHDNSGPQGQPTRSGHVVLSTIGVIPDTSTAQSYGQRVGAAVVVWGQILTSAHGEATIRFQVRETLDRAVNPEYPLVLPVSLSSPEIFARELDLDSDPTKLKPLIAAQSRAIASFALGLSAYLDRDLAKAIDEFGVAAGIAESNPELKTSDAGKSLLYFYLGTATMAQGRIEQGQGWLKRAGEVSPQEPAIPLSLALGYGSLGRFQERDHQLRLALDLIDNWLQTHPDSSVANYDRGIIRQIRGEFQLAQADFAQAIARDPMFYAAYINLGQVRAKLQDVEGAAQAFRAAIALAEETGTNASWAHLNLALVYERFAMLDQARQEFEAAIAGAPQVDWMYYHYAQFLDKQHELDAALQAYRTMIEVSRKKGWANQQTADFLRNHGLLRPALRYYIDAVQQQPKDALLRASLAETYYKLGDITNALHTYEDAIAEQPDSYYIYGSYAGVLFEQHDFEKAAQMYEQSLRLRPIDWGMLLNLGDSYRALKQNDKARASYGKLIELGAQFPEPAVLTARERLRALSADDP